MARRRRTWLAVALIVGCLATAGCARVAEAPEDESGAEVKAIQGSPVSEVTLTEESFQNIGVKTQPVRQVAFSTDASRAAAATGSAPVVVRVKAIPITALIYDPQGKPWTYTMSSPRTFVRAPVVIQQIADGTVYLKSGPPTGTPVVTVGATELLGSEVGVGGE